MDRPRAGLNAPPTPGESVGLIFLLGWTSRFMSGLKYERPAGVSHPVAVANRPVEVSQTKDTSVPASCHWQGKITVGGGLVQHVIQI